MNSSTRHRIIERHIPDGWYEDEWSRFNVTHVRYRFETMIPFHLTGSERRDFCEYMFDISGVKFEEQLANVFRSGDTSWNNAVTSLICDPYAFVLIESRCHGDDGYLYSFFAQNLVSILSREQDPSYLDLLNLEHQRELLKYMI